MPRIVSSKNNDALAANLTTAETNLRNMLLSALEVGTASFPKFPEGGVLLASNYALATHSAALRPFDETVKGVPLDERSAAANSFDISLQRPESDHGLHLLCTCGYKGSGKTVQQALNMCWFLQKTQGVAIEVTYNGDQALLPGKSFVRDDHSFKVSVAIRILHRALGYLSNNQFTESILSEGQIFEMIAQMPDPVVSALKIVKTVVNAPPDAKILLTVDEIIEASDHNVYSTQQALSELCKGYLDQIPSLYLSVSAYGAISLAQFATGSSRILIFQNLPPLEVTLGLNHSQIHLLPPMLQPFYDEKLRAMLPYDPNSMELYSDISKWLMGTGGHPRRLQSLLAELSKFEY